MSGGTALNLVIGVVILALLIARQLTTRPLRASYRLPLILAVIGVIEFTSYLKGRHDLTGIGAAVAGSLVIAAVTGALRAFTVKVWRSGAGQLWRKGTWLTALLWIVSLAAHLGYDYVVSAKGVGDATILLYLAVTFTVQYWVLLYRVDRDPPQDLNSPGEATSARRR
jgi:hypothetical protein